MQEDCYVVVNSEMKEAKFIGVFQYSHLVKPTIMAGGHNGGTIAYPVAVVKMSGRMQEVKISDVVFKE